MRNWHVVPFFSLSLSTSCALFLPGTKRSDQNVSTAENSRELVKGRRRCKRSNCGDWENFLCKRTSERERTNERGIIAAWRVRKRHCSTAKRSTRSSFGAYRARGKRHADAKESSTRSSGTVAAERKTDGEIYHLSLSPFSLSSSSSWFLSLLTLPETGRTEQRQS